MYKEIAPKTKRFPCPNNCGRSFNFKHTLEDHIRTVCGKMRFACPYCSKQCRKNWSASLHIKYRHPGRKNYVIDIFKRKEAKEALKVKDNTDIELVEIDDNDDPSGSRNSNLPMDENNCPFCGEVFHDSLNLGMHIKYDHLYNPVDEEEEIDDSREQQEEIEDTQNFNEDLQENLVVAELSGSLEDVERNLSISEKGEAAVKSKIASKTESHTRGRTNFLCPNNCGSIIKYEHNLPRHIKNVCGKKDRNLNCPFCQFRSKFKNTMTMHIKNHHRQEETNMVKNEDDLQPPQETKSMFVEKEKSKDVFSELE